MRTRRSRRNDLEHRPEAFAEPGASYRRRMTRRTRASAMNVMPRESSDGELQPAFRSDIVLRNIGILAFVAAIALTFLNIFLYTAIFAVGLLAPAWQTFKALEARSVAAETVDVIEVRSDDESDEEYLPPGVRRQRSQQVTQSAEASAEVMVRNWQTYWVMAAILFAADGLLLKPLVAPLLPSTLYAVGLFSSVAWLTRNRGGNAHALYSAVVRPAFIRSEKFIDKAVDLGISQVDAITQHAVVKVNEVVAPYAKQLEHAAAVTSRQIGETQGRLRADFGGGRFLR